MDLITIREWAYKKYVVDLLLIWRDNGCIDRSKGQGGRRERLNSFYSANNPSFATRYGFDDRSKCRMFKICTNSRIHNSQHSADHSSHDGTVSELTTVQLLMIVCILLIITDLLTVQESTTVVILTIIQAWQTVMDLTIVVCRGIVAGLMIVVCWGIVSILRIVQNLLIIQVLTIICILLIVLRIYNYGRRRVYGIGAVALC